jgi:general secretion pathway protein H
VAIVICNKQNNALRYFVRQRGFTFIELLIVLVVMGIVLGMAVVQLMPDDSTVLHKESQLLALLLENAGMEARASGKPLGWSAEKNGYRFWKKNEYGEWVHLDDDVIFRPRTLPDGFAIAAVSVESKPLQPGEQMSLNAFSFTLPFSIRMTAPHFSANIVGTSTGAVSAVMDSETNG